MSAQDPVEIDQTTDFMWKATAAVATLASGFVAEKVVALGWRAISGRPAPREEDQLLNYKLAEIVTFAIISGATVTLVRELGLRQAAKWYSARRPDSPSALRAIGNCEPFLQGVPTPFQGRHTPIFRLARRRLQRPDPPLNHGSSPTHR